MLGNKFILNMFDSQLAQTGVAVNLRVNRQSTYSQPIQIEYPGDCACITMIQPLDSKATEDEDNE